MDVLGKERAREGGPRLQHRGGRDAAKSSGWFLSAGLNVSFPARATATGRANGAWRVPNAPNGARRRRGGTRVGTVVATPDDASDLRANPRALGEKKVYFTRQAAIGGDRRRTRARRDVPARVPANARESCERHHRRINRVEFRRLYTSARAQSRAVRGRRFIVTDCGGGSVFAKARRKTRVATAPPPENRARCVNRLTCRLFLSAALGA